MNEAEQVIERLTLVAPLGLRFWDATTNAGVGSGLVVTAYPSARPTQRVQSIVNPSGVYVFAHLPGLRNAENGTGDATYWINRPAQKSFVVEVTDAERRFHPCSLTVDLPVQGLFTLPCGSPVTPLAAVSLFSTPDRTAPAGMAVIRAELWDAQLDQPAAWAILEAYPPGQAPMRGMADARGRLALLLPYPEPALAVPGSPVAAAQPLWEQRWSIPVQAFYTGQIPATVIPDLCTVLLQTPALLWGSKSPPQPFMPPTLKFGQELVLRSENTAGDPPSVLLITPVGSPIIL